MTYKLNTDRLLYNLKWVILLSSLAIFMILLFGNNMRMVVGILIIFLILIIPQIYLIAQYQKFTSYDSFQIDYENETFNINLKGQIIQEKFSDLKNIQYHKAIAPKSSLSLVLMLCEHLYYYRLEFIDGSTYYLTSLLSPKPIFDEKGIFYPYFIKVERKYAKIKRKQND